MLISKQRLQSFSIVFFIIFQSYSLVAKEMAVNASYLGNAGVMLAGEQKKILFDPLFRKNFQRFSLVPENIKTKIFANKAPYENVDVILISHTHGDHFDAKDIAAYLKMYSHVQMVAPTQAIEKLKALPEHQRIAKQLHEISMKISEPPKQISVAGVLIEAVRIPHLGWPERADIENIIYRVTLDDVTVMHLGDSDIKSEHFAPYSQLWAKKGTEHAFIPDVFAIDSDSENRMKKLLNVKNITYIHVRENVPAELKKLKVDFFSIPSEMRVIGGTNNKK